MAFDMYNFFNPLVCFFVQGLLIIIVIIIRKQKLFNFYRVQLEAVILFTTSIKLKLSQMQTLSVV